MGSRCSASNAGWYAVLCLHVNWLLLTGLLKGLGVLLPTLQEQFTSDTWVIGGLIATITGAGSFAGPLSRPLEMLFGTRIVVTVCGFLLGASIIVSSFSTSAVQMALALSLISGPCLMIASILLRATTGRYFTTNYATVNAIATSGHSVGLISIAPLTQVLLDIYGWRGALLLLGAISMLLGVCGFLLRPLPPSAEGRDDYLPIITSEKEPSANGLKSPNTRKRSRFSILKEAVKAQRNLFGCTVCSRATFWIAALLYCGYALVGGLWLIYFVAYAESKGFSGPEAVTFTTAAGIGNLVIKILVGFVVDRCWLKLRLTLLVSITNCSLALFTLPWMNSYWLMIVNAFIFNGFIGVQASLSDIYTRELLGAEDLVPAFSSMGLISATIHITFGFFPGWTFDQTGSYDKAFIILGFLSLLPLVSFLVENVLSRRKDY